MQKTLASQPLASGWTAVQAFHGIKPCTSSFSRLIRSIYKRGVLTLGCSLSPEPISWETSSKVTSSVRLPFTSFLRILPHSSLPSILRGLDHGRTPRLFLRPFQLLKYWNTAMAPLFHQPKAPPTWSRTKGLLPGAGGGVPQKPLPPWPGIRPAWCPLQDQSYHTCTVLLLVTLHYGQWFLALPIQLDFEHYVLFVFAFSRV